MSGFVNTPQLSSQMEVSTNLENLAKIEESSASTTAAPYVIPNYPIYDQQQMDLTSKKHNFNTFDSHNKNTDNVYQNSVLPLDSYSHNQMAYSRDYSSKAQLQEAYDLARMHDTVPTCNQVFIPNIPIAEVPRIPPNPFHTTSESSYSLFNANKDRFNNFHNNFDTHCTSNKPLLDNERKKTLENTVRFIENILSMNTAKNKNSDSDKERSVHSDLDSENINADEPKNNEKETNHSKPSDSKPKSTTEDIEIEIEFTESQATNVTKKISTKHKTKRKKSPICTSATDQLTNSNPMDSENFVENVVVKQEKPNEEESQPIETNITIKVELVDSFLPEETPDYDDAETMTQFHRDPHGVPRDQIVDDFDGDVMYGEMSYQSALDALKTAPKTKQCYECPHCDLFFVHPKRFLVHYKWHSFGLTNERRMMVARAREQRKIEKKEARVVNRMNAMEIKDDTASKDEKVYACKDCDKMFVSKGSLKNHRQRTHPVLIRECKICGKHVPGWAAMRQHVASHGSGTSFPCTVCGKQFSTAHTLAKHSATHMEKTVSCPECPKKFGTMFQLKTHQRVHEREKTGATHICPQCGKAFYESYNLQVHIRTHSNERPFHCQTCNTSFGTNSGLKRHIKVSHNSAKPFECPICHRSFVSHTIRDRHVVRNHGDPSELPYRCKLCDCKYTKQKDLNKHIYKVHPIGKTKKKKRASEGSDDEYFEYLP